ncbi:hypothetical protein ERJ75_001349700 [Trypanosoma vivax]|uniref:PrimPol-like protein 2 n=1 Tax=Trypanosoma vivax (strain Y486) TaxID=1055687 RepID=G0U5P9_TRYVY|nr:hypothetical protein TRVL_03270 [Trypanosoma vivax]KAH8608336.1 hypothetical protein ERJ75_001349700 [Trypanosoma vivax]CCC51200.1 conserved hypothetical protein [Trypanosoma vivax Y486]
MALELTNEEPSIPAATCESLANAIFAITGPTAGVLHIYNAEAPAHIKNLGHAPTEVISKCLGAVSVPSKQYWCAASYHHTITPTDEKEDKKSENQLLLPFPTTHFSGAARRPDPRDIPSSFYSTRREAVVRRNYEKNRGDLLIAADLRNGSSGKIFSTLPRAELPSFIGAIKPVHLRNLYVLVDEDAAVDPFFDIDCHLPFTWMDNAEDESRKRMALEATANEPGGRTACAATLPSSGVEPRFVEQCLAKILCFLRDTIEAATGAKLSQCLVLTSSVLVRGENMQPRVETKEGDVTMPSQLLDYSDTKLSFHVHFRLENGIVFASIRELHHLMSRIRTQLDESLLSETDRETLLYYRMLRHCIDFSVYSRWRPFRLPYNVKLPHPSSLNSTDVASLDLLQTALLSSDFKAASLPDVSVGSISPTVVHTIDLSALHVSADSAMDDRVREHRHLILSKLFFMFRFLLPVVPGVTAIGDEGLNDFLRTYIPPFSQALEQEGEARCKACAVIALELASIQRDSSGLSSCKDGGTTALRCVTIDVDVDNSSAQFAGEADVLQCPFHVPRPPRPPSYRVPLHDIRIKDLVAEVFRCFSRFYNGTHCAEVPNKRVATYGGPVPNIITGSCVNVDYEDGIRAYYARQKVSRFCLKVGREHRSTYPQLYLTYGSVKMRCYSNDCSGKCYALRWSARDAERNIGVAAVLLPVDECGYPNYDRLEHIRDMLFPPLSPEELLKRYGTLAPRIENIDDDLQPEEVANVL